MSEYGPQVHPVEAFVAVHQHGKPMPQVLITEPKGTEARAVQNILAETVQLVGLIEEYCHDPRMTVTAKGAPIYGSKVSDSMIDVGIREAGLIEDLWRVVHTPYRQTTRHGVPWLEDAGRHWFPELETAVLIENTGGPRTRPPRRGTGLDGEPWVEKPIREGLLEVTATADLWYIAMKGTFGPSGYRNLRNVASLAAKLATVADRMALDEEIMEHITLWMTTVRPRTLAMFEEPEKVWLTIPEAAELAGKSDRTVQRWKQAKKLRTSGDRVHREDVLACSGRSVTPS